jgi:hypothetical protein
MISSTLEKHDSISETGMQNAIQELPDADAVMESVGGVLTVTAYLAGYTPASVGNVRNGF